VSTSRKADVKHRQIQAIQEAVFPRLKKRGSIEARRIRISVINNRPGLNGVQDEIEITSKDRKTLRGRRKYAQQCADKMNAEDPKKNWIVLEWRE